MEYIYQIILNTIVLASLYSLLALGFNYLYSVNKFFDITFATYLLFGAYSFFVFSKLTIVSLPLLVCIILSILFVLLYAFLLEYLLLSKMKEKKTSGAVLLIATLGILSIVQAIVSIVFSSNVQTLSSQNDSLSFLNINITYVQIAYVFLAIISYLFCVFYLAKTKFGIQLRAVSDSFELATVSKINVKKVRYIAIGISVFLATITAILYGMDTSIEPYMGLPLLLKAVIVAIIGGLGKIKYGFYSALFLAIIENITVWNIGGEWKDAVAFLVLIIVLLYKPKGIFEK